MKEKMKNEEKWGNEELAKYEESVYFDDLVNFNKFSYVLKLGRLLYFEYVKLFIMKIHFPHFMLKMSKMS